MTVNVLHDGAARWGLSGKGSPLKRWEAFPREGAEGRQAMNSLTDYGVVYRAQRAGRPALGDFPLKLARAPKDPRAEREAELLRRCPHPNIPKYEGEGLWTAPTGYRYPYLGMEWVEGLPLYDWAREQERTSWQVLQVLAQVASALAQAHAAGIVHRDVKGDNIRVTAAGRAVLLDWGSRWAPGARPLTDTTAPPDTTVHRPPEQRLFIWPFRRDTEARWQSTPTDGMYSLGVALYRVLTGVYPPPLTEGGEPVERRRVRPTALATVCLEFEALALRLLSEAREQRGTAEALAREAQGLVATAGPEADRPILPTASAARTAASSSDGCQNEVPLSESGTEPVRPRGSTSTSQERSAHSWGHSSPAWLSWASAAVAGGLLVVVAVELHHPRPPEPGQPWLVQQPSPERTDAGVGEEALLAVENLPTAGIPAAALAREMPKQPFPGRRKPPCERPEKVINGGCWAEINNEKPP